MLINDNNIQTFRRIAIAEFDAGLESALAGSYWPKYSERVDIGTEKMEAGWLGFFPQMQRWAQGSAKTYDNMEAYYYSLEPEDFAAGFQITKNKLLDASEDPNVAAMQLGLPKIMRRAGAEAAEFFDRLCAEALANGHLSTHPTTGKSIVCHDGQPFFDAAHPNGAGSATFANEDTSGGVSDPYYLIDDRRKPVALVVRKTPELMFSNTGDLAFDKGIWRIAIEARAVAGYTLPQFAFRSDASISLANYRAHANVMKAYVTDKGHKLAIRPNTVISGNSNEFPLVDVFEQPTLANGETNMGTRAGVSILHVPFLD